MNKSDWNNVELSHIFVVNEDGAVRFLFLIFANFYFVCFNFFYFSHCDAKESCYFLV